MWKTGHSLIKDKMREMNAPIAGEMSGHMFFTEGFYGHDDALYGAARLLRILADAGKTVAQLLVRRSGLRLDAGAAHRGARGAQVRARRDAPWSTSASKHDVIDVDGVRVLFGDGWGLIRASNTQPVIVARYEATHAGAPRRHPRRDGRMAARAGRASVR